MAPNEKGNNNILSQGKQRQTFIQLALNALLSVISLALGLLHGTHTIYAQLSEILWDWRHMCDGNVSET